MVVNVIGALTGDASKLLRSITKTYRSVFPTVALHPVYLDANDRVPEEIRNVDPRRHRRRSALADVPAAPLGGDRRAGTRCTEPERCDPRPLGADPPVDDVPLLTDAYAPTDALLHP